VLIVAPMSGHYPTLLRGTVETFLPNHDVYITEWADARMVPLAEGRFDLDDYIDYIISMLRVLGGDVHVVAVCQPSVPVLARLVDGEAWHPSSPASMILMGGPIDTRVNPTEVNKLAEEKGSAWYRERGIMKVPFPHPGFMREVYPGFLQLSGFMAMNLDRHLDAHAKYFRHLVRGDGDGIEKHRELYDEYLSVMDLTAEFYLQTVEMVFVRHALPGEFTPMAVWSIRSGALRSSPSRARTTTFPASARPRRRRASAPASRRAARRTICSGPSATTASSTARASAPKSRRASPTHPVGRAGYRSCGGIASASPGAARNPVSPKPLSALRPFRRRKNLAGSDA
jgi:hypothetical protein